MDLLSEEAFLEVKDQGIAPRPSEPKSDARLSS